MDNVILPVGSVVGSSDIKAMIAGYFFDRSEGDIKLRYLLVPYPAGLVSDDVLTKCDIGSVSLISEGYNTEFSSSFGAYAGFMNEYLKDHTEAELFALVMQPDDEADEEDEEVSL